MPQLHALVAERGLAQANLRFLAAKTGTSARMLHYYFGSAEGLVHAVVEYERDQQKVALGRLFDSMRRASGSSTATSRNAEAGLRALETTIVAYFDYVTAPERRGFLRFYFELLATAARNPERYEAFLGGNVSGWVGYMQAAAKEIAGLEIASEHVRAVLALARGFYIEVQSGVPVKDVRAAFIPALRVLLAGLTVP
ncbi:MAG: TetR family transcriptional regulator [Spirochaetota bacterium]